MTSLSGDVSPNTTRGEASTSNKDAEDILRLDLNIGPGGRDPSATLPRILNFLKDEDIYRLPSWASKLEKVSKYVDEADAARLRGELGYDSPHVVAQLEDARIMIKTHRDFSRWKDEPVPWSTDIMASQPRSTRLPNYPKQYIQPKSSRSQYKHLRIDYLPRDKRVQLPFPELYRRGKEVVDYYQLAEELFFEKAIKPKDATSSVVNGFQLDNDRYERCIQGGIAETRRLAPLRLADDIPVVTVGKIGNSTNGASTKEPEELIEFSTSRGWQRAALQQCLNMFTNHENRVINTPWRRVVLPFEEPVPEPKEIVFYPRALAPDSVPHSVKEPFGWVHFYNKYRELTNVMAGWQRRRYNLENWADFERPALPMNFNGPLLNPGLSIYDDHWIRMGSYLKRLHVLLQQTFGIAPRAFLGAILRDIQAGIEWRPKNKSSRRRDRVDIMRRPEIDVSTNDPDAGDEYVLLDEADAAWLRFLCQPSRTAEMCDFKKRPDDNLSIIFDNRLQVFLFNPNACPSPSSAAMGDDIFYPDLDRFAEMSTKLQPTLEKAREYINGGGGSHGNETYQFTQAEAEYYLRKLAALNRCSFRPKIRPLFDNSIPDPDDDEILEPEQAKNVPTTVGRPNYEYHPEHRILWRYPNDEAFERSNREYRDVIFSHLISAYELDKLSSVPVDHFEFMFDHFRSHSLPTRMLGIKLPTELGAEDLNETLKRYIQDELTYEKGSYPPEGLEKTRAAPSWSDLLEWEIVPRVYKGTKDLEVPVPERTTQFLRNLAFRMGRTIAHAEEIERRLQISAPRDESGAEGKTQRWESMSRAAMGQAYQHWWESITYGVGDIQFKPPTLTDVIEKADPDKTLRDQFNDEMIADVDIIREGLINDCVENRNTMYPSRLTALEDSSGYINDNNYEPDKVLVGYKRPSLFKWATAAQRRYQASYYRRAFFDMKRWPLHHQSDDRQKLIKGRKDEVIRRNPSLMAQKYGLLTARIPEHQEKQMLHGMAAYPGPSRNDPVGSVASHGSANNPKTKDTASEQTTKDSNSTKDLEGTKPSEGTKQRETTRTRQKLKQRATKDPIQTSISNSRAKITNGQKIQSTQPSQSIHSVQPSPNPTSRVNMTVSSKTNTAAPAAPAAKGSTPASRPVHKPTKNLVPITRPSRRFVPGNCTFPVAETEYQRLVFSQALERALYPQSTQTIFQRIAAKYKDMTEVESPQIPLLPPAKYYEIPQSSSKKRKIPAEFIARAATEAAKKRKPVSVKTSTPVAEPTTPAAPADGQKHPSTTTPVPVVQPEATPVVPPVVPEVKPVGPQKPPTPAATPTKTPPRTPTHEVTPVKPPTPADTPEKPATKAPGSTVATKKPSSPAAAPEKPTFVKPTSVKPRTGSNLKPMRKPRAPQVQRPTSPTPRTKPPPSTPAVPTSQPTAVSPEKKKVSFRIPQPGDPEFGILAQKVIREQSKREAKVARERQLAGQTQKSATDNPRAMFNEAFPYGWYRIGQEVAGIDGAMQAMVGSIAAATKGAFVPTYAQLQTAWNDDRCFYNAKKTFPTDELFRLPLEQANAALQFHMGVTPSSTWVQIGVVYKPVKGDLSALLLSSPYGVNVFNTVYWIYADAVKNSFSSINAHDEP